MAWSFPDSQRDTSPKCGGHGVTLRQITKSLRRRIFESHYLERWPIPNIGTVPLNSFTLPMWTFEVANIPSFGSRTGCALFKYANARSSHCTFAHFISSVMYSRYFFVSTLLEQLMLTPQTNALWAFPSFSPPIFELEKTTTHECECRMWSADFLFFCKLRNKL